MELSGLLDRQEAEPPAPWAGGESVAGLEVLRAIDLVLAAPWDTEPHTAKGIGQGASLVARNSFLYRDESLQQISLFSRIMSMG